MIRDEELVSFLQWALPRLGYRWRGYRKVRRQVKRRIAARLDELGLEGLEEYRRRLEAAPEEWKVLDELCWITISRFYRDRQTWDRLRAEVLPRRAEAARRDGRDGRGMLRALSVGCASGEEPYTLKLCWELDEERPWEGLSLQVEAFDAAAHMVDRALRARYAAGSLKELPSGWVEQGFEARDGMYELREDLRRGVAFSVADLREWEPAGGRRFDLIFCRNLAFMYFDEAGRRETLERLAEWTMPGGALVVGNHDVVPGGHGFSASGAPRENLWIREES